jgi:molybdopterin-guanine dinucleotide biosynthesis protein A
MTLRTALILAGGKGRRFQLERENWQDKALAELLGKPLLIHAVESVQKIVDEVIVCVNDDTRRTRYLDVLARFGFEKVKLVIDEQIEGLGGPIVAILTGLKHAKGEYCLTLPSDMPLLQPKVAEYLFDKAESSQIAVPKWPDGRLETLIMICERSSILRITDTLCQLGRPRPVDIIRGASEILFISPLAELRNLDPDLKSFVNINIRSDLTRLQTREVGGLTDRSLKVRLPSMQPEELQTFVKAVELKRKGDLSLSGQAFSSCSKVAEQKRSYFWGAIGREQEGKSLFESIKHQKDSGQANDIAKQANAAIRKAAENYAAESTIHEANGITYLAGRAKEDQLWCESWAQEKFR